MKLLHRLLNQQEMIAKKKISFGGFTLIELLVVVAIIGILAAVGVVAYNGYTSAAQKAVTKQNFKNTVRYFTSEVMKCEVDSSQKAFGLSCPVQVTHA